MKPGSGIDYYAAQLVKKNIHSLVMCLGVQELGTDKMQISQTQLRSVVCVRSHEIRVISIN